jgi:hypothetical protein
MDLMDLNAPVGWVERMRNPTSYYLLECWVEQSVTYNGLSRYSWSLQLVVTVR